MLKKAGEAAVTGSKATIESALAESDAIERMANDFATAHEDRLVTGECSPKSSSTYLCILYAFEDMGAHIKDAQQEAFGKYTGISFLPLTFATYRVIIRWIPRSKQDTGEIFFGKTVPA